MKYVALGLLALVVGGLLLTALFQVAVSTIAIKLVVVSLVAGILEAALRSSLWASARRRKGKLAPTGSAVMRFVGLAWGPALLLIAVPHVPVLAYTAAFFWAVAYWGKKFVGA